MRQNSKGRRHSVRRGSAIWLSTAGGTGSSWIVVRSVRSVAVFFLEGFLRVVKLVSFESSPDYVGWYFWPLCKIETITHHTRRATATIAFFAPQRAFSFSYTFAQRRVLITSRQAVSTRMVRNK